MGRRASALRDWLVAHKWFSLLVLLPVLAVVVVFVLMYGFLLGFWALVAIGCERQGGC
jgi:hypothetical protein